jgi:hypothetical protein
MASNCQNEATAVEIHSDYALHLAHPPILYGNYCTFVPEQDEPPGHCMISKKKYLPRCNPQLLMLCPSLLHGYHYYLA